eukprot:c16309_g1_i1.p1 GENE.c16309_g1_i1~~c16309_g1_i1.p1  ORF type:complete len:136 (+),score=6.83 c16309_g1_i1:37-444(+)
MFGFEERTVFEFLDFWQKESGYTYTNSEREVAFSCAKNTLLYQGVAATAGTATAALGLKYGRPVPLPPLPRALALLVACSASAQLGWMFATKQCMVDMVGATDGKLRCKACDFMQRETGSLWARHQLACNRVARE